jgi:hypothetical protein
MDLDGLFAPQPFGAIDPHPVVGDGKAHLTLLAIRQGDQPIQMLMRVQRIGKKQLHSTPEVKTAKGPIDI